MPVRTFFNFLAITVMAATFLSSAAFAESNSDIKHVLLISVDGMHAIDFTNCSKGVKEINGGEEYCPHLASLSQHGVNYLSASASKPSDSFPGLTALVTGATPRSTGAFYDVSYDRSLSPPSQTTPYGIVGGPSLCPSVVGTQVGNDEEIDVNLNSVTAGEGINPDYLPRDPKQGCKPIYPHEFIRVNTIFNVVKDAGGYTAWTDKHQSYELTKGPDGKGVDDFFAPEINSPVVPLNSPGYDVAGCRSVPDPTATGDWTKSFQNIQCYDKLKVQAILNQINGKTHDGGKSAPVPAVFKMNFQAVSVGQKLNEASIGVTGGYLDALATPSPALLGEIKFVDESIGRMIEELKEKGLFDSTLIVISAKHGQSPIDPHRLLRIPADNPALMPPSALLSPAGVGPGFPVALALEDDISVIWLSDQSQTKADILALSAALGTTGGGEVFGLRTTDLLFNSASSDPRTPDIIVNPNVGVVYTGGTGKVAEHGGFAHDDRNVVMLLSNPNWSRHTFKDSVETRQVAPTILKALGLDPDKLKAVRQEGTEVLPGLPF